MIQEGKNIHFFSFGQNLPFALPPSYQELCKMFSCKRSTVT